MKFKVGDKARLTRSVTGYQAGTEVIVGYIDRDVTNMPYKVSLIGGIYIWVSEFDLEPIEEHKPVTVTISAEEYANFQEMEKLLAEMYGGIYEDSLVIYKKDIEKLLKNKYNP